MERFKVISLLGALGVLAGITGCGHSVSGSVATPQKAPATMIVIHRQGFSMQIPRTWQKDVTVREASTAGTNLGNLLPLTPAPSAGSRVLTRYSGSPWFSEFIISGTVWLTEVSASNNYYTLQINAPLHASSAELHRVAESIHAPPVATATDIVHFMRKRDQHDSHALSFSTAMIGMDTQWVLAGGNFATAQEEFALFRTVDGGQRWSLMASSVKHDGPFPNLLGRTTLFFETSNNGILAESTGFGSGLLVYRTTDGGRTWQSEPIAHTGMPNSNVAPTIQRETDGNLTLKVPLTSGKIFRAVSDNGGQTWLPTGA